MTFKTLTSLALIGIPLASNAAETANKISPEDRVWLREEVRSGCVDGRPAAFQTTTQIQAHVDFCNCGAEFISEKIKEEDVGELGQDLAEFKRSKKIGNLMMKLTDAAYAACRDRVFK